MDNNNDQSQVLDQQKKINETLEAILNYLKDKDKIEQEEKAEAAAQAAAAKLDEEAKADEARAKAAEDDLQRAKEAKEADARKSEQDKLLADNFAQITATQATNQDTLADISKQTSKLVELTASNVDTQLQDTQNNLYGNGAIILLVVVMIPIYFLIRFIKANFSFLNKII